MKKENKLKTLTIDRSKWLHGEGSQKSRLLRDSDGKMCCLGFLGLACGATKKQIRCKRQPNEVPLINWPKELKQYNCNYIFNNIEDELMRINDRHENDKDKERIIKKIFKDELDIDVEYKDSYK